MSCSTRLWMLTWLTSSCGDLPPPFSPAAVPTGPARHPRESVWWSLFGRSEDRRKSCDRLARLRRTHEMAVMPIRTELAECSQSPAQVEINIPSMSPLVAPMVQ